MNRTERFIIRCSPGARAVHVVFVAAFPLLWLVPACKETPKERYERRLREADKSMQHSVHSDRLLELMAQLKHLTYSRLPPELELSEKQDQRFAEIRWIAQGMAAAAQYIPDVLEEVELPEARAQEFRTLSDRLHLECLELEEMARDEAASPGDLVTEFSLILDTCDGCHTRFRVLSKVRVD